MSFEIYVHIPFCARKCNYCDFLSFPIREEAVLFYYMEALYKEVRETAAFLRQDCPTVGVGVEPESRLAPGLETESCLAMGVETKSRLALGSETESQLAPDVETGSQPDGKRGLEDSCEVSSIFIGGGTPSLLPEGCITDLLNRLRASFIFSENIEISLEANPGTLTSSKLKEYREAGVNRLSMGLQSPDDRLLSRLGRIHTWEEFLKNYVQAREAGFDNINIDLMSGLPGQSVNNYKEGLRRVLALKPDHISSYSLILEEGTPFYHDPGLRAELPDEETDRTMYHLTKTTLKEEGYVRYEISNYALPGKECRHNLGYWSGIPYLGFGLGAASYWQEPGHAFPSRFSNIRDMGCYLKEPFQPIGRRPEYEVLSKKSCIEEYMFLGLRKIEGVSLAVFEQLFSQSLYQTYGNVIEKYRNMGLMEEDNGYLRLTEQGIDVSDYIFTDLML